MAPGDRSVDVYVAPATLESFGIAALEARCAGLPVLARTEAGVGDFIKHGRDGLLAADDTGMAANLLRLALHPELRERIAAHNRRVTPPFQWDDLLPRTYYLYERAVAAVGGQHLRERVLI